VGLLQDASVVPIGDSLFRRLVLPPGSTDPDQSKRIEICLAAARVFLSATSLLAISIDPTDPIGYYSLTRTLLLAYVIYSVGVLAILSLLKRPHPLWFQIPICAGDIVWGAILTAFTQGPNSPFFAFFTFMLVASAYRWGFLETVLTGCILGFIFATQWMMLPEPFARTRPLEEFDMHRVLIRAEYLVVISVLLGYLAQADKRLKAERYLIASALSKAQEENGLRQTIEEMLAQICNFYRAAGALMPVLDKLSGRSYLTEYKHNESGFQRVRISEISASEQQAFLYPSMAGAWHVIRSKDKRVKVYAVDERGMRLEDPEVRPPLPDQLAFETLLSADVIFGEELWGRLYLLNPRLRASRKTEVAFLQTFARQVAPAIYNVYLWRRLRSKIGSMERAHIARDLHDGVIQSLASLEVQIQNARSQADETQRELLLGRVQSLLRNETRQLRELTNQLKSMDVRPGQLVPHLLDLVDQFGHDSGITARFSSANEDVVLPARICREILAIVREALANVRKHSRACNVVVRFSCHAGQWQLAIDDNGGGFDFSGSLSLAQLDANRKGPVTIKERVRLLKGDLVIESRPGIGSCLTITAPIRAT
jgi:signal transduction histidine kinase